MAETSLPCKGPGDSSRGRINRSGEGGEDLKNKKEGTGVHLRGGKYSRGGGKGKAKKKRKLAYGMWK